MGIESKPWQEPSLGYSGENAQHQGFFRLVRSQCARRCGRKLGQHWSDAFEVNLSSLCKKQPAADANKQRDANCLFQGMNLFADRANCQKQLGGCAGTTAVACRRFEHNQARS